MTSLPDDPAGAALSGPHRNFALGDGPVLRYPPLMGPFATLGPEPAREHWEALAALEGPVVGLFSAPGLTPAGGWTLMREIPVLEMAWDGGAAAEVDDGSEPNEGSELVALGQADVPEMLDLTARTQPGPFLAQTIAYGGYVGIRRDGALAAMAGRRLHPDGWIEVSAVCTDPAHRGAGLGRRVTAAVAAAILAEGARPFLHVVPTNASAIALYEGIGFAVYREASILIAARG